MNQEAHPEFFLTRSYLTFQGEVQVAFENRSIADAVTVRFLASKTDKKRVGCTITRTRAASETVEAGGSAGALEAVLELLNVHPQLPGEPP